MMGFSRTTVRSSTSLTSGSKENYWLVERSVTIATRGQPSQADMPSA